MRVKTVNKIASLVLSFLLICSQTGIAQAAAELNISAYLNPLSYSSIDRLRLPKIRFFSYNHLTNDFRIVLDKGDLKEMNAPQAQEAARRAMSYFLVGITLPDESFWVNLRPDSPDNIIDDYLARTDLGKVLLEADLELKKDTARFTSPQSPEGKLYWDKLYQKAGELFGSENISIPTLTRPWIVPDEVIIRESADSAYIYKAGLKVLLEQDYLKDSAVYNFSDPRLKALNEYSSQLIRQLIIPKLTKEVNTSQRYASLRQVYYSLILARWFKTRFSGKDSIYSRAINKNNLDGLTSPKPWSKLAYFNQYQKSFKQGEYNLRTQVSTTSGQVIRSYFSGGINLQALNRIINNRFSGAWDFYSLLGAKPAFASFVGNVNNAGPTLLPVILTPEENRNANIKTELPRKNIIGSSPITAEEKIKQAREEAYYVSITMGGDKVAAALIDADNKIVGQEIELRWNDDPRFNNEQIKKKDPVIAQAVMEQIDSMILDLLKINSIDKGNIIGENASLAGPTDRTNGIFGSKFPTPNLCFDKFQWRKARKEHLATIGISPIFIDLANDAEKAVDGETVTARGLLHDKANKPIPGGVLIIGGGIGGAASDGKVNEPGHNTVQVLGEDGQTHWRAGDKITDGTHPVEIGADDKTIIEHSRDLGREYLDDPEVFLKSHPAEFIIDYTGGMRDLEDVFSGPNIRQWIAQKINEARQKRSTYLKFYEAIEHTARLPENKGQLERAITPEAQLENPIAIQLIKEIGTELGKAIAALMWHHRGEAVTNRLILVSGINENMGKDVYDIESGILDIWIYSIRKGMFDELVNYFGMDGKEAEQIAMGILHSQEDYTRELRSHKVTDRELLEFYERKYPPITASSSILTLDMDFEQASAKIDALFKKINGGQHYKAIEFKYSFAREMQQYIVAHENDNGLSEFIKKIFGGLLRTYINSQSNTKKEYLREVIKKISHFVITQITRQEQPDDITITYYTNNTFASLAWFNDNDSIAHTSFIQKIIEKAKKKYPKVNSSPVVANTISELSQEYDNSGTLDKLINGYKELFVPVEYSNIKVIVTPASDNKENNLLPPFFLTALINKVPAGARVVESDNNSYRVYTAGIDNIKQDTAAMLLGRKSDRLDAQNCLFLSADKKKIDEAVSYGWNTVLLRAGDSAENAAAVVNALNITAGGYDLKLHKDSLAVFFQSLEEYRAAYIKLQKAQGTKAALKPTLVLRNDYNHKWENLWLESSKKKIAEISDIKTGDIICDIVNKTIFTYIPGLEENKYPVSGNTLRESIDKGNIVVLNPLKVSNKDRFLRDELIKRLDSRDVEKRHSALRKLKDMEEKGRLPKPVRIKDVFQHSHTKFSYSPYYPAAVAWRCYQLGLEVSGIVDHDTDAGADEFIESADILGLENAIATAEIRMHFRGTPWENMTTNSPGNNNETYVVVYLPYVKGVRRQEFSDIRQSKNERFRETVEHLNSLVLSNSRKLNIDYDKDVLPLAEDNNPTERHLGQAISQKLYELSEAGNPQAVLNLANELITACGTENSTKKLLSDKDISKVQDMYLFGELIRERVVKLERKLYPPQENKEILSLEQVMTLVNKYNGRVDYCFLGGEAPCEAEKKENLRKFLEFLFLSGFKGIDLMPNRNSDEEVVMVEELARDIGYKHICNGMDVNKPFMPFVYAPYSSLENFILEALIIVASVRGNKISSSPVILNKLGGIDLRNIPLSIQPIGSFNNITFQAPDALHLRDIVLDKELKQLAQMVQNGILPSSQRVKELVYACYYRNKLSSRKGDLVSCLTDICQLQEEQGYLSEPELKESLMLIER